MSSTSKQRTLGEGPALAPQCSAAPATLPGQYSSPESAAPGGSNTFNGRCLIPAIAARDEQASTKIGNVFPALPEGANQWDDIEAIVEIFAEVPAQAPRAGPFCSGNRRTSTFTVSCPPAVRTRVLAVRAIISPASRRHVADLVQENGTFIRELELPGLPATAPVKAPFS